MKRFLFVSMMILISASSFAQKAGYEKSIEINGGFPLDKYQKKTFGIGMVNGYRFNDNFFAGLGVGYEYLEGLYLHSYEYKGGLVGSKTSDSYDIRNNIQIFGRIKANLTSSQLSPFVSIDLGYNIGLSDNEIRMAHGLFFEPAFGIDYNISDKQTVYIMIGYNGQQYEYKFYNLTLGSSGSEMMEKRAGKLSLRLGFNF